MTFLLRSVQNDISASQKSLKCDSNESGAVQLGIQSDI
jgi:hypothetical protein